MTENNGNVSSNATSSGISFTGLLTIAFIVLKLTHQIDWSWVWVLCPLWIGFAVLIAVIIGMLALAAFASLYQWIFPSKPYGK